ncbi:MAG: PUA domain-containing protein [Promethearchaeota archaeon]
MKMRSLSKNEIYNHVFSILSYQFNENFAYEFLKPFEKITFKFSKKTGKIKHIYLNKVLQANYRAALGTFSISIDAAQRILSKINFPDFRVQVQSDISEFISEGRSVFAKHVKKIDPNLKIGNEVFVVDENDKLLAIGKLSLPPKYIPWFKFGSAVNVRQGINSKKVKKS